MEIGFFDFQSCISEVSANLKNDDRILANIKTNINQTFKKNLYASEN